MRNERSLEQTTLDNPFARNALKKQKNKPKTAVKKINYLATKYPKLSNQVKKTPKNTLFCLKRYLQIHFNVL